MAELPQFAGLYKKYSDQGLHIIGLESENSEDADVAALCKSRGVTYQITTGGELKGAGDNGLPYGYLFGADGKLALEGDNADQFESKIKELLAAAAAALAGPGPYVKLAPLVDQIKTGAPLNTVLKTLLEKKTSKDADEAKEAQAMYEALRNSGNDMLKIAKSRKASDPLGTLAKFDRIAVQFGGDEVGAKAKDEADALRNDPKVKVEIEADDQYKKVETLAGTIQDIGPNDLGSEAVRKKNEQTIKSVVESCQQLVKQFPNTAAAKKAADMLEQFR